MVKKEKTKKIKKESYRNEEQEEIIRFVKILLVVLVFIVGIYCFTKFVVKKDKAEDKEVTAGSVNYSKIILGSLLNQAYDEYYVFAYHGNANNAIYYGVLIDKYMSLENAKKVYWADLDNSLNEKYIAGEEENSNPKAKKVSELKLKDYTLIKVKNGKIEKYIETVEKAKKELGL